MTQPLVYTIRDEKRLRRELELLCPDTHDPRREAEELWERCHTAIMCYPADWSVESRRPSEDVWTFGKAQVRYRIVPDAEAVEILSIRRIESDCGSTCSLRRALGLEAVAHLVLVRCVR